MASIDNGSDLGIEAALFKAADKLRGNMEPSDYKHVALGLIFLKHISDGFELKRQALLAEYPEGAEDPDEYLADNIFWVPQEARWSHLQASAKQPTIGRLIDEAMIAIEKVNPSLKGVLPKDYGRPALNAVMLGELIDLISGIALGEGKDKARDLLGRVYEYFLGQFAGSEGKRGGEFYTPASVVRVLVEVLEPLSGRVYDPCCGSGGMFVQTEKFVEAHGRHPQDVHVYGQELNERTWRMAKMNLAIHGIGADLGPVWGDTFARDLHPGLKADYVLANPPFNIKDWARNERDGRWRYGVPPANNANYAWLQHILSHLAPDGSAGVVLANGSMSSNSGGEGAIRAEIVDADLVSCMVALPTQLFRSTGIPVCLWFFAMDNSAGKQGATDRRGQVLFIDARELGHMVDRANRAFSDADIAQIADTYHAWRGTDSARGKGLEYADVPGFCRSAALAEIKDAGYALTPGRYVGAAEVEVDPAEVAARIDSLTAELLAQFDESERLARVVREQLGRLG